MHKRLPLALLILGLFLIGITFIVLYSKAPANKFCFRDIGTHDMPPDMIELDEGQIIGETFVPNFDNLFKIAIFMSTKGVDRNTILRFNLKEIDSDQNIVSKEWRVSEITPEKNNFYQIPPDHNSEKGFHYHIQFKPVSDSKGKKFYFYFISIYPSKGEKIKFGIWKEKYYEAMKEGSLVINSRLEDNFLAFRTYNTWSGNIHDILKKIGLRFSEDIPFMIFYACLLLITFGGIFISGEKYIRGDKNGCEYSNSSL